MTKTFAPVAGSQARCRQTPGWDGAVTAVIIVLALLLATFLMMATGMFAMAGDSCAPGSPCLDEVGRGIEVSLVGMAAVLVIGLCCVIGAAVTRTLRFGWALATLLLLLVPFAVGCNIANHAMQLSSVAP
ncbi:hypothetical protein ACFXPR_11255 [Nocardia tengchongensis]|uniref:hypothetical protein n=1 Tax=Nocardia tengchongensis TaxID=2055889 RepID=UPI0036B81DDA